MVKRDTKSNQKAPIPKRRRDNHAPPSETEPLEWPSKPEQRSVRPRGDAALPRASAPVRTISHGTSHGASRYGVDDRVEKGFSSSECVPSDKNQATSSSDEDLDGLQERIKSAPTHGLNARALILKYAASAPTDKTGSAFIERISLPTVQLPGGEKLVLSERVQGIPAQRMALDPHALVKAVPPQLWPNVRFHPQQHVKRQTRQAVVMRLFGGYLAMLCGMAGHASKESAEAYLRCGTDSVAQALGMMEPKFRKACIASEIFKQGLMQWLSLPAWPPCVSCSRRSLVENPLLTVARALALADELVGAYRKCVLETEYPRVAAGLLPSWERLEQEAKRQGAALPGVHGGLPEHPDREQTSKHEEAKEGAGLTTPSFLRLTEYEKQGGVSAVAEKRIDDAGGEGNGKGTGKEERKESDKAFLQKVAQVAREAGLLSSESDSGNSSSSATSSSGTDSDASATSGMSTSSSSSASESATASDDAHKWHSPGTEDGSSSGGLTTKVRAFVLELLSPYVRAGVVDKTSRQLISDKATAKVLAVHSNAPDSSFLVSQGHKIRKLVDAYVKQICSRK